MSDTIRYYTGDLCDLDGMTREEVEDSSVQSYDEAEDAYEGVLNEIFGTVSICDFDFDAGSAFRKLDPIAFRVGVSESVAVVDLADYPGEDDTDD